MTYFKKFILLTILIFFSLNILIPQNLTAMEIAQNFALIFTQKNITNQIVTINSNSLSAGLIDSDIVMFLTEYSKALRENNPELSDKQIEQIITTYLEVWKKNHTTGQNTINIKEIVLKSKKFSIKGLFYKIRDFIKLKIQQAQDKANSKEKFQKNMESNIKFFPFIQFMLGFELAESFAMIYIIDSGYTTAFLTALMASLGIISFTSSAVTGFITSKVSKRTVVLTSLIVHTLGSISLALVPYSVIFVVLSQILPTIGVAGLAVSLGPFFYASMEALGKDRKTIKEKYSANDSFFSIVMAFSSLIGGALVVVFASLGTGAEFIGQHIVVMLAAAIDIFVTIGAVFKTHKEVVEKTNENNDKEKVLKKNKKRENLLKTVKSYVKKIFTPMKKVVNDKQTFSFVITNLLVNSVFFAITTLLLQPIISILIPNNQMLELYLAIIYFAANGLQSVSKKFALKINPILQKPVTRTVFFIGMAILSVNFLITSNPLFLITLFISINFFYGVSSVSEIMDIHDILSHNARPQWLALKAILGIIIATIVQSVSAAMLTANITETMVVGIIAIIVTGAATFISLVAMEGKTNKLNVKNILTRTLSLSAFSSVIPFINNNSQKDLNNIHNSIDFKETKKLLACA
ncbi:MFS transporter [Candidatus Ruminimicrobium bovinum]|uniref:MFS transporter n=1 Tax=Candidatus Ruminimicrobium bovinum TaxID=3242779 RepID=UPI0039B8A6D9